MTCNCGGDMERGFIPDFGMLATWASVWIPGQPDTNKSWLERVKTGGGVSLESAQALALEAHRCADCGVVQLYALKPVPAGVAPVPGIQPS